MGGRVVAGARLVAGAGNDTAIHHQHCANRDLAALAGCSSVDVDHITSRRAEPESFHVVAEGEKVSTPEDGNHMSDLAVTFRLGFPEGEGGDRARAAFPRSVAQSRDRLCTVSRTVQIGVPVEMTAEDA